MRFAPAPKVSNVFTDELDSNWDGGVFSDGDHTVLTDVTLGDGNKVWEFYFNADGGNTVAIIESSTENYFSEFTSLQFDLKVLDYNVAVFDYKTV
jgi:hypothetical protein